MSEMGNRSMEAVNRLHLEDYLDEKGFIEGNGELNKGKKYHIINSLTTNFENGVSIGKNSRPVVLCLWDDKIDSFYDTITHLFTKTNEEREQIQELNKIDINKTINMNGLKELILPGKLSGEKGNFLEFMYFLEGYISEHKDYDAHSYSYDVKNNAFDKFESIYGTVGNHDVVVPLSHFVETKKMVCLHSSLLAAMILERYQKENNVPGKIYAARIDHKIYSHMMVVYQKKKNDTIYMLDAMDHSEKLGSINKNDLPGFKKIFNLKF